ncbi:putative sulfate exporter family transporter [Rhodococcus spelaei]|uniref:Putative sulfate exporter family transporter n=1 Tax=Rhodococcus spelaei TaxID=2546320 RepID=A0A541BRS7_9NOCA|nr:putative sulfate exporter family transporter [Rhodococcus spelaei]TQF75033.1 putative sulfate exporter family transporter [Rhodococcus spelaei]
MSHEVQAPSQCQPSSGGEVDGRSRSRASGTAAGVGLCVIGAAVAMGIGRLVPTINPMLIAIVLGALVANLVSVPGWIRPGLDFSSKRLLRVGVALLGLQLMFSDVVGLGWGVIAVVVAIVVLGIVGTMYAGKLLGLSWTQRVLIACGFSICGAAAVAAADGVVDAREEELLTAVALVVVFGTLMIPTIPLLADLLGLSERQAGMWAGGSIHEVAQVVASGGIVGGGALAVATVVKLARVLMLAPVMAYLGARQRRDASGRGKVNSTQPPLVPMFVLGFLGCVALRSSGLLPGAVIEHAKLVQTALLTAAMFALGVGVRVSLLRSVGPRPFVLAAVSTVWVAVVALLGVWIVT